MHYRTSLNVGRLLYDTLSYLERYERPRKKPFCLTRPEAATSDNKPCKWYSQEAFRFSLVGALKMAAKDGGYTTNVTQYARWAIFDASAYFQGCTSWHDLAWLDGEEYDTREIIRLLKRAIRDTRKYRNKRYATA